MLSITLASDQLLALLIEIATEAVCRHPAAVGGQFAQEV
jgi:hypothetical protein